MKKLFTKGFYIVSSIILALGMATPAMAQYTIGTTVSSNQYASAMTTDSHGNIYVLQFDPNHRLSLGEIVKYPAGSTTGTVIVGGTVAGSSGLSSFTDGGGTDYADGIAVTSNGNIYYTTDVANSGNIYKVPFNGTSYGTPVIFEDNSGPASYYNSLAVDASDNLFVVQYDPAADGGQNGNGAYEIAEYANVNSYTPNDKTHYSVLYQKLGVNGLNDLGAHSFSPVMGLAISPITGDLFVCDSFSGQPSDDDGAEIWQFTKTSGYLTGTKISTGFRASTLAFDSSGNLYATQNNVDNASTSAADASYGVYEYANAIATQAPKQLYTSLNGDNDDLYPQGMVFVNSNDIWVADGTASSGANAVIKLVAPTVTSINTSTGALAFTNAASVNYTVTFSTAITGVTASNFSITSSAPTATVGTPTTSNNIIWTVPVNTGSGDGNIVLNLANTTNFSLPIGNTLPFAGQTYTVDKTAPTIAIGSPSVANTVSGPVTYSVTYADANFKASTLTTGNITLNKTSTANGTVGLSGSGTSYTVTISGITGLGTLGISIAANTATDQAGNNAPASGASTTFNVVQPIINVPGGTVTVPSTTAGTASASTSFSISGTNLTAGNLTVTAPSTSFQVSSDNSSWGATASIPETGTLGSTLVYVRVSASAGVGTPSGNVTISGGGATTVNQAVSGTVTNPATTISSLAAVTSTTTNAASVQYTATFAASISGLTSSDFTLAQSGVSGASITGVTGSGTSWTITVGTGSGDGTIQLAMTSSSGVTPSVSNVTFQGAVYTIDRTAPSVTIGAPSATYANSSTPVTWSVSWSDANLKTSSITLAGLASNINKTGNANFTSLNTSPGCCATPISIQMTGLTGDGTIGFTMPAGSATDNAGNSAPASSASATVIVDNTAPTISISAPSVSATSGGPVSYTVTYADANFNSSTLAPGDIGFVGSGSVHSPPNGTIAVTGSGLTRTVTISNITGDGSLGISIAAGTATDLAGNSAPAPPASTTFTVDNTAPTVTTITADDPTTTSATTLDYTITFNEGVTGVDAGDFTATTTGGVTSGAISVTPTSASTYNITIVNVNGTGTLRLDLNSSGTGITDLTGNAISGGFTGGDTYTIDQTAPAALSLAADDPNPNGLTHLDYQITFSKPVTGVDATDFTMLASAGLTHGALNVTAVSSTVYDVSIASVSGSGTFQVNLNSTGTGIIDAVGNAIASGISGDTYTVDQTAPTVTSITATTPSDTNPTNATSVTYTVTFSEAVTNVDAADFTVTTSGTAASGGVASVTPVSGSVYTVSVITIRGDGTLRLDLNSSGTGIFDLVGNAITTGFTSGDTYTIDNSAPAVFGGTFLSNNANTSFAKTGDVLTLAFTTTETVQTPTITIAGHTIIPINSSGNTWSASYTETPGDTEGQQAFDLDIYDLAGNHTNYNSAGVDLFITYDQTPPLAAIGSPSMAVVGNTGSGSVSYTVTYSDANFNTSTLAAGDITLNATGTATGTVGITGSGTSYTVTISDITGLGTLGISVAAGKSSDQAGNTDLGAGPSATFNVVRSVATLSNITLSNGTLSPSFSSGTTSYTAAVGYGLTSILVTPTTVDGNATVTVNGASASAPVPLTVGANVITIVVTAQDGVTQKTYTVTVTEVQSAINTLASVKTSAGFAQGTTVPAAMAESVINSITSLTVTPVTTDGNATVTVNGVPVTSGQQSAGIALNVGSNAITIVVTAANTATKTYTLTVTRAASANDKLSNLVLSNGTLSPAFGTPTNYLAYVANGTALTVTPTVADPNATLTINGSAAASGAATAVPLIVGNNTISIVVTAENGNTKTYTVVVNEARSPNNTLFSLATNGGLSQGQTVPTTLSENVPNATTSITVTPTTADPNATVTVNNVAVTSGNASGATALNVGQNTITTVVTAQTGATLTYTLTVTRAASSLLSGLSADAGPLNPAFAPLTTSYAIYAVYGTTSTMITPTAADPGATIQVNGNTVSSGSASAAVPVTVGNTIITITVTAADNSTTTTYTVGVNVARSPNNTLFSLATSGGLSQGQTVPTTLTENVPNATTSITVTPVMADPNATVTVNNTAVTSGQASASIPLNVGSNTITIVGTAQNGTTLTYTLTVTRAASSLLSGLAATAGSLNPAFASLTTSYAIYTASGTGGTTITPTAVDPNATITVNGSTVVSGETSPPIPLTAGNTIITIAVTAADNSTTTTYTVGINVARSTNSTLFSLTTSGGLSQGQTVPASLTENVPNATASITVTPTVADPAATVTVNSAAVTSGSPSGAIALNVGQNTITTIVTAQDGSTSTYTLTVTRAASSLLNNLALSNGTLSPAFASGTTGYAAYVANGTASTMITPTAVDPGAIIQVNGSNVSSGSASAAIPLSVGNNTITVAVTAADNSTTTTYTVGINVARSSNTALFSFKTSGGLSQGQTVPTTLTENVANPIQTITVTPTTADPAATVTVNNVAVASGAASSPIALTTGPNTITTVVTAQNGSTQTYTLTVTRADYSSLASLTLSSGSLAPAFASAKTSYTASVGNGISSMTVTPTATDHNATIKVNGNTVSSGSASPSLPLTAGSNTITIAVTAADNTSTATYTVAVTRAPSANDNLVSFKTSLGLAKGVPVPTTLTESATNAQSTITITPATADPTATVTVNNVTVASGTASGTIALTIGSNTITTVVTAQNGAFKTYTLTVTRAPGSMNTVYQPIGVEKPSDSPALNEDGINVHQGISPNGDGINDFLQIDNIASYPDNNLKIMNRNGMLVYEAKGYDNSSKIFDGHSNKNGQMQLPGTYFYSLDYTIGGVTKHKTGFVILKY